MAPSTTCLLWSVTLICSQVQCEQCQTDVPLTVSGRSSVLRNQESTLGANNALTPVSNTSTGFWHSDNYDLSPWIGFKMPSTYKVAVVEVDGRKGSAFKRFNEVEVTVGPSPNVNDTNVKSCGTQSYAGGPPPTYKFECPEGTSGQYIFVQKKSQYLQVNLVKVLISNNCNCELKNNVLIVEGSFDVNCADECQAKCQEDPCCEFFTFNIARKKCGLRKFAPGGRSFSVGNLSGLKNESPSEWKKIENSVYVGRKFKTSTAGNCKTACDIDNDCSTMIYNQFLQQCSINYGSGPFREIPLPLNNPLGISSYQKCTA